MRPRRVAVLLFGCLFAAQLAVFVATPVLPVMARRPPPVSRRWRRWRR